MALTLTSPFALWEKGRDEGILTDTPQHGPHPDHFALWEKGRDEGILHECPKVRP